MFNLADILKTAQASPSFPTLAGQFGLPADQAAAAVEARFAVAHDGGVIRIELWPEPDADPCEVTLEPRPGQPGMPAVIEVRHGDSLFGRFHVEEIRFEAVAPAGETS